MRRITTFLLTLTIMLSLCLPCYAAEITDDSEKAESGDVYARYIRAIKQNAASIEDGNAKVTMSNGDTISVSGAPENAVWLKVVPIPSSETEAWEWFQLCLGRNVTPIEIFDIYFEDYEGNRFNAKDIGISITCNTKNINVYSVTTDGTTADLNGKTSGAAIHFNANGSHYYILATLEEDKSDSSVNLEKSDGGNVEISNQSPEPGATVIITPHPDDEMEVDEIIIKDKNGNHVPVTNNGDGTYSYIQPDGDVTIRVTFKRSTSSDKPSSPATGDNRNIGLWLSILLLSTIALIWCFLYKRKCDKNRS